MKKKKISDFVVFRDELEELKAHDSKFMEKIMPLIHSIEKRLVGNSPIFEKEFITDNPVNFSFVKEEDFGVLNKKIKELKELVNYRNNDFEKRMENLELFINDTKIIEISKTVKEYKKWLEDYKEDWLKEFLKQSILTIPIRKIPTRKKESWWKKLWCWTKKSWKKIFKGRVKW